MISAVGGVISWAISQRAELALRLKTEARQTRGRAASMLALLERYTLLADWHFDKCQALTVTVSAGLAEGGDYAGQLLKARDEMWTGVAACAADTVSHIVQEKLDMGHDSLSGDIPASYEAWSTTMMSLKGAFEATVFRQQKALQAATFTMRKHHGDGADPDDAGTNNEICDNYMPSTLGLSCSMHYL